MKRCCRKVHTVALLFLLQALVDARRGVSTRCRKFCLDLPNLHAQQVDFQNSCSTISIRGGGRAPSSERNAQNRFAKSLIYPVASAGATIVSIWHDQISPILRFLKDRLSRDDDKSGTGRNSHKKSTLKTRISTMHRKSTKQATDNTTAKVSALLVPSRVLKLTLLALLIAEGLDRVGILYEDTPALLKARLEDYWFYTLQPKLVRYKKRMQLFYWNQVEPLLPEAILYSDFYNAPLSFSSVVTTKVSFAIGASIGMIASPVLSTWICRFWKPIVGVYGLAEVNHHFNSNGKKFVKWFGETPETLGSILNGLLNQVLNVVRGVVFGDQHVVGGHVGERNTSSLLFSGDSRLPLLGWGGEESIVRDRKSGSDYSLGLASRNEKDPEFYGLQDELKDGMIVNGLSAHRVGSHPMKEKREFAMKGFWLGCCLGFAVFRL
ncbi:hypothetical protein IV203_004187 [Nitzschia inconspicua]|uniref:Uncharacterized protein n=1 Tax=Nitzschia inconspicua TaxID=303405 RepID=A0A9K3L4T4_9STRA|nr:hypothetical protein IV203_004187 [Nitzschia inconspicua]